MQLPLITVPKVKYDFSLHLHPVQTEWKELFKSVLMVTGVPSATILIPGIAELLMLYAISLDTLPMVIYNHSSLYSVTLHDALYNIISVMLC